MSEPDFITSCGGQLRANVMLLCRHVNTSVGQLHVMLITLLVLHDL